MTAWDLVTIAAHRWVVTLLGVLLTALAIFATTMVPPVYFAQSQVVLLPPTATQPNGLTDTRESLVSLAGVLAQRVNETDDPARPVSDSVTLVAEGRREGATVRQQNVGGQWAYRFDKPVLEVQVVGESPTEVSTRMTATLRTVETALTEIQDDLEVGPADRIRTVLNPTIAQVSVHGSSTTRAMVATGLLGLLTTLMVLAFLGHERPRLRGPVDGTLYRAPVEPAPLAASPSATAPRDALVASRSGHVVTAGTSGSADRG